MFGGENSDGVYAPESIYEGGKRGSIKFGKRARASRNILEIFI